MIYNEIFIMIIIVILLLYCLSEKKIIEGFSWGSRRSKYAKHFATLGPPSLKTMETVNKKAKAKAKAKAAELKAKAEAQKASLNRLSGAVSEVTANLFNEDTTAAPLERGAVVSGLAQDTQRNIQKMQCELGRLPVDQCNIDVGGQGSVLYQPGCLDPSKVDVGTLAGAAAGTDLRSKWNEITERARRGYSLLNTCSDSIQPETEIENATATTRRCMPNNYTPPDTCSGDNKSCAPNNYTPPDTCSDSNKSCREECVTAECVTTDCSTVCPTGTNWNGSQCTVPTSGTSTYVLRTTATAEYQRGVRVGKATCPKKRYVCTTKNVRRRCWRYYWAWQGSWAWEWYTRRRWCSSCKNMCKRCSARTRRCASWIKRHYACSLRRRYVRKRVRRRSWSWCNNPRRKCGWV